MPEPKVSIIVTTYNRKDLLKETIASILDQTYTDFELIIVDNYSDYDFISFIESFNDPRIRRFQNKNNGIIAINRNYGIKRAIGKYIAFCDDDDLWRKNKLEEQIKHLQRTDIIGVGSTSIPFGDLRFYRENKYNSNIDLDFLNLLIERTAPFSSLIIKSNGMLFDESSEYKCVEDIEFQLGLTLKENKKIRILAEPLIYYMVDTGSSSHDLELMSNSLNVTKKYKEYIPKEIYNLLILHKRIGIGIKVLRINKRKARVLFKKALKYSNKWKKCLLIVLISVSALPQAFIRVMLMCYYKLPKRRRYLKIE